MLGLVGHRDNARDVNVAFSAGTFIAACVLTVQVIASGPMLVWGHEFYIDALNVFLVALTAFGVCSTTRAALSMSHGLASSRPSFTAALYTDLAKA